MNRLGANTLIAVLLLTSGLWAKTQGTFRGEVVRPPRGERTSGLVYLMGRDGNVRRVVIARAAIVYDSAVPTGDRTESARKALVPGAEVRVTALVDAKSGEWTASRVEVIARHVAEFDDEDNEDGYPPDEVTAPSGQMVASRTI